MSEAAAPFESAALREVTGPCLRPGGTALTDRALSFCDFPAGARLLDVGCGMGGTVAHLRSSHGFAAFGIDPSRRLVAAGKARPPSLPLSAGVAEALPVAGGALDGILCECVLSVVADPRRALAEFHRALRPGGLLILSDLYRKGAAAPPSGEEPRGPIPRAALGRLLDECGFAVSLWEDHTPLLRELAARLLLAHGRLEPGWCGCDPGERPGYFLLVAAKED